MPRTTGFALNDRSCTGLGALKPLCDVLYDDLQDEVSWSVQLSFIHLIAQMACWCHCQRLRT